jgi:hypothetical protein
MQAMPGKGCDERQAAVFDGIELPPSDRVRPKKIHR